MHDGLVAGIEWKDLRELPLPWESLPIYLIASQRASSLPLLRNGKPEDKEFASELMDGMWNGVIGPMTRFSSGNAACFLKTHGHVRRASHRLRQDRAMGRLPH